MKTNHMHEAANAAVRRCAVIFGDNPWPAEIVLLAMAASSNPMGSSEIVTIAARAYLTLTEFERAELAANHALSPAALAAAENPDPWPIFVEPTGDEDIERRKAWAASVMNAEIERMTVAITGRVPLAEMLSWTAKEEAARAVEAGNATPEQEAIIAGEALVTGEAVEMLCGRIVTNANAYRAAVAAMTGLRRKSVKAVDKAVEASEVDGALEAFRVALVAASRQAGE